MFTLHPSAVLRDESHGSGFINGIRGASCEEKRLLFIPHSLYRSRK